MTIFAFHKDYDIQVGNEFTAEQVMTSSCFLKAVG